MKPKHRAAAGIYSPQPFADFLERLKQLIREKEVDLILIGLPRNMDGSHGPAAQKVEAFVAVFAVPSLSRSKPGMKADLGAGEPDSD